MSDQGRTRQDADGTGSATAGPTDARARDALARLAAPEDPAASDASPLAAEEVIDRAAAATTDPDAAAAFVTAVGTDRLREAVETVAAGRPDRARRGRRALDALRWVRWAAACERPHDDALCDHALRDDDAEDRRPGSGP